jgi:hypothetical protein
MNLPIIISLFIKGPLALVSLQVVRELKYLTPLTITDSVEVEASSY